MHEQWVDYIISAEASLLLAFFAFFLAVLYVVDLALISSHRRTMIRREGVAVRAANWMIFGFVFLLFGRIIPLQDLETWRATARIALLFLMLSEIAFEVTTMWPDLKRTICKKQTGP